MVSRFLSPTDDKQLTIGNPVEARGTYLQEWNDVKAKGSAETLCINSAIVEFDLKKFQREKSCESPSRHKGD
jgi:hypothetical protein